MSCTGRAGWIAIGALVALLAGAARAEGFVDFYSGVSLTQNSDFDLKAAAGGSSVTLPGKTRYEDSVPAGVRGGYWFESLPWLGLAGDISVFGPNEDAPVAPADILVFPITPLVMLRAPIGRSEDMPGGYLQPYVAVGPGFFYTTFDLRVPFIGKFNDDSFDVGIDGRAGVRFVADWIALFVEYRYTRFEPTFEDTLVGVDFEIDTTFETHHVDVGVGFQF